MNDIINKVTILKTRLNGAMRLVERPSDLISELAKTRNETKEIIMLIDIFRN